MAETTHLRSRMDAAFAVLGKTLFRHRFKTLGLMLLFTALLFSQLPKVAFDASNESYFHKDDPTIQDYNAFLDQFGREEVVVVAVNPPEVFDKNFLERFRALHEALEEKVPYLAQVTSLINARDTRGEGDRLIVEDLLKTTPSSAEGLALLKKRALSSALYPNFLISEDGRFVTLVVEPFAFSPEEEEDVEAAFLETESADSAGEQEPPLLLTVEENGALVSAIYEVMSAFQSPEFPIYAASGPMMDIYFNEAMSRDMGLFMGLAFLTIGVFLLVLFRRLSGLVLPLLVVILSLLATIGLMGFAGVPFTIPTTILPSFLLATGVGASVHLLAVFFRDFRTSGDKQASLVYAMGHSGLPITMTGLTTSAGLFAFSTADMAPVAQLGIFGGIGVLLAIIYTLVLLPALLAIFRLKPQGLFLSKSKNDGFDRLLNGIADFATSNPKSVVIGGAVLLLISVVGLFSLNFSMNFVKWIPETEQVRRSVDLIDKNLKGSVSLEVVVDTERENGLYEAEVINRVEAIARFSEAYKNQAGMTVVGKTHSVNDVLKETHKALNGNDPAFYRLPQERPLVAQELLLFENSGSDDLENLVDSQFSKARLSITVPWDDAAVYVQFVSTLKAKAEELFENKAQVTVTGTLNLFTQMISNMMTSMMTSYLIAGVVITIMMMLLLGSFRLGLVSMLVNFSPIVITMGLIMGFSNIPLDAFTLLIGSIALGLAVDDTIHFFHNFRNYYSRLHDVPAAVRQTLLTSGRAMLFTTTVLAVGFWLFMLATLNNVFNFGFLTGIALILALLSDFLLAPALMMLVTRTRYGNKLLERWAAI